MQVAETFQQTCCNFLVQLLPDECLPYIHAASGKLPPDAMALVSADQNAEMNPATNECESRLHICGHRTSTPQSGSRKMKHSVCFLDLGQMSASCKLEIYSVHALFPAIQQLMRLHVPATASSRHPYPHLGSCAAAEEHRKLVEQHHVPRDQQHASNLSMLLMAHLDLVCINVVQREQVRTS